MTFTDNDIMSMKKRTFNLEKQLSIIHKHILEKEIEEIRNE